LQLRRKGTQATYGKKEESAKPRFGDSERKRTEKKRENQKPAHIFQASIVTSFLSIESGSRVQLSVQNPSSKKTRFGSVDAHSDSRQEVEEISRRLTTMPTLLLLLRPTLRRQRSRSREVPPKQDFPTRLEVLSVSDHLSKFRLSFLILGEGERKGRGQFEFHLFSFDDDEGRKRMRRGSVEFLTYTSSQRTHPTSILSSIEQHTGGVLSVSTCSTCFLVVAVEGFGKGVVKDESDYSHIMNRKEREF